MNYPTLLAALPLCVALFSPAASADGTEPPLKVFLQGSSAAELQALVEAQGGKVTHQLHIIDAVGAELTRKQLEQVRASPLVSRFFDDLAVSAQPQESPEEAGKSCDIGGSMELDISGPVVSWKLYNKKPEPALLTRLEINWPVQLGAIKTLSLGGKDFPAESRPGSSPGSAVIEFVANKGATAPSLGGSGDLRLSFDSQSAQPLHQRDFQIEADFSGDCSVELIPGYDDNHEDFHYAEVVGAAALHRNGITGKGITVAVIDSGLWEDPALVNDTSGKTRLLARYDAIADTADKGVFDASGHGTHMTSVIAHNGPTTKAGKPTGSFKGIAPDVGLVSVKAFDVAGQGDFLDIVRGIQWVVDNRETYNIRVLNLSFAARPRWHYWLDPINQAAMHAWASGITLVAAAGNEGPEAMTIGSPGNLPFLITVGAVTDSWTPTDRDDDYIPDFSSRGPTPSAHIKPDIVAPGGHITGLTRPGSSLTLEHPEYMLHTGEFVMTGSSQATAVVSGIVALLLQLQPELSPDDIKCKLTSSAEPAINNDGLLAYSPFQQGHGYVSATRAVTLGERGCGNAGMDIQQEMTGRAKTEGPAIVAEDGSASLPGLNEMVSPEPAVNGLSTTRRWGAKAHIERQQPPPGLAARQENPGPFDWMQVYIREREAIEKLAHESP